MRYSLISVHSQTIHATRAFVWTSRITNFYHLVAFVYQALLESFVSPQLICVLVDLVSMVQNVLNHRILPTTVTGNDCRRSIRDYLKTLNLKPNWDHRQEL